MSWYVLNCRAGREEEMIRSLRRHLSPFTLESVFTFRCERLWRAGGTWKLTDREMFPGYLFLQSSRPDELSGELEEYREILHVMEERGTLLPVYEEEEDWLKKLCGEEHFLRLSYGYKDRKQGLSRITAGPLSEFQSRIRKIDWHRRYAQIEVPLARRSAVIFAGVDIAL